MKNCSIHCDVSLQARSWGVELDATEASKFRANIARFGLESTCEVTEGDVGDLIASSKLADVTVISLYLLPEAIEVLRPLLDSALQRGARIIANSWGLPWLEPTETKEVVLGHVTVPIRLYKSSAAGERLVRQSSSPNAVQ